MKEIELTDGTIAIIDDNMFDRANYFIWMHKIEKRKCGDIHYAVTTVNSFKSQRRLYLHQLVMNAKQTNLQIDHKNTNGLDNRIENLRYCTHAQNAMNRRAKIFTISKYKGVCYSKKHKCYRVRISIYKKRIHLGYFINETDAAIAYNNAAIEYFGEFARINFISIWDLR